ncbi:hypothetical protein M422DRAFT_252036 [Sphaerobolus stellatus SS14]|uniref:Uncharacterized protein n=1 Tax=Sphaerobolus stellatus (strain SS14) TaxID=990650 RepID=A0A0C9VZD6_SPHS4|nr:hypothetical protein M422DRAFT_252036 [Sphaerobolus stellatus SS14]
MFVTVAQAIQGIPELTEHSWCSIRETQSIDMNALREEIKDTISATIKEKLCSDADSITTVSHSMTVLEANARYWSNLNNKATCRSCRAFELQLKMAEEKVNILLYNEAPEEVLLEAAQEGIWGKSHIQDGAVVNRTAEYSGIQQMVRQAVQNASHEAKTEKLFLAKAGVKMGNPPTYSGEHNLEKFKNWVCLTDEVQEWFYQQKWFMLTLLLNKVAVNYDNIMQGSMTAQQLHQELLKLAKQMIELPDVYSYRRRFMSALKPDIREQVLKKGFTPEFSNNT